MVFDVFFCSPLKSKLRCSGCQFPSWSFMGNLVVTYWAARKSDSWVAETHAKWGKSSANTLTFQHNKSSLCSTGCPRSFRWETCLWCSHRCSLSAAFMEDFLCWGAVSSRAQWARLGYKTRPWGRVSSEKCEVPMTRTSGGEWLELMKCARSSLPRTAVNEHETSETSKALGMQDTPWKEARNKEGQAEGCKGCLYRAGWGWKSERISKNQTHETTMRSW